MIGCQGVCILIQGCQTCLKGVESFLLTSVIQREMIGKWISSVGYWTLLCKKFTGQISISRLSNILLVTQHLCVNWAAALIFHVMLPWEGRGEQDRVFLRLTDSHPPAASLLSHCCRGGLQAPDVRPCYLYLCLHLHLIGLSGGFMVWAHRYLLKGKFTIFLPLVPDASGTCRTVHVVLPVQITCQQQNFSKFCINMRNSVSCTKQHWGWGFFFN